MTTPMDEESGARLRRAAAALGGVLTSVASEVGARVHERCPYRARGDRCTFAGGCRNQRREAGSGGVAMRCAGDHLLQGRDP